MNCFVKFPTNPINKGYDCIQSHPAQAETSIVNSAMTDGKVALLLQYFHIFGLKLKLTV